MSGADHPGFFDANATTPLSAEAREAWLETAERFWHNPSGLYREAAAARQKLEDCREEAAELLGGCGPEEIVFLSGATEAGNAVIRHAEAAGMKTITVSSLEHPSLLEPARHAFRARLAEIPAGPDGLASLGGLEEILLLHRPRLAALMAVNNETGVLQPWREALALCREHGVLFHCDAAQWIGKLPASELGSCDFVTGSAHKFGGPKGTGFLKVPPEDGRSRPFRWLRGGPQEERRRAGTENLAGIAAMMAAWRAAEKSLAVRPAETRLGGRRAFEEALVRLLPEAGIVARDSPRLWNTVLITVPPPVNVKWLARLGARGFAVSTGSACSRGAGASDVLAAMGLPDSSQGQVLRLSSLSQTTTEDWLSLADALAEVSATRHARPDVTGRP